MSTRITNLYSWEVDKQQVEDRKSKNLLKENIKQFVTVVSDVKMKEKEILNALT